NRRHLVVDRAENHQNVRLLGRKAHDFGSETRQVVMRRNRRHELDRAARRAEWIGPERAFASPIDQRTCGRGEEVLALRSLGFDRLHKRSIVTLYLAMLFSLVALIGAVLIAFLPPRYRHRFYKGQSSEDRRAAVISGLLQVAASIFFLIARAIKLFS